MSSKETLSKIMALLNLQDEVKLAAMKLENGTTIEAEAFEPNQEVFIVSEDGEKIAMPVGDYMLEDGQMMVVSEEGIIAEIKAPEEEAPEAPEAEVEVEVEQAEEVALTEERVREIVAEMLGKYKEEMSAEAEEAKAQELAKQVELKADEPAAKPVKHNPESTSAPALQQFSKGAPKSTLSRVFEKINQ